MQQHNWLERMLGDWGEFVARRRFSVLIGAFVVTLVSLPFAYRAVSNLDVNLFNQASDSLKRFRMGRELSEEFGGDIVAGVVSIPDGPTPAQVQELKAFALLLTAELAKAGTALEDRALLTDALQKELPADAPWLRHVECRTGQGIEQALRKIAQQQPYVLLTPADVDKLKAMFDPAALDAAMERVAATLPELPPNSAEKIKLQEDPLGLSDLSKQALDERLSRRKQALAGSDAEGFFLSPDNTTLAILSRAVLPATRLDFNRALMTAVQRAENRAIAAFRATNPTLSTALKSAVFTELAANEKPGALQVGYTGMPAVSVENEMSLKYDLLGNTTTAFIGVLLLFLIVFRRIWLAWDVTWTTALVIVWTLAVAGIVKGSISILGGAFTCILLGTGTDYAIHLQNTYHHLRQVDGFAVPLALRTTLMRCGPGIITASLTTMVAFFGVGFTKFTGLAEFGLLAGVSVLLGCLMMLIVFPALLCRPSADKATGVKPLGLGLPALGRWLAHPTARGMAVFSGVAVLAGCILFIKYGPDPGPERVAGVRFDAELGNLRSLKIKAIPLRERLAERFKLGLADLRVVVTAPDEARAFAAALDVTQRLQPLLDKNELTYGGNALDFIPAPEQQRASITALESFNAEAAITAFQTAAQKRFGDKGLVFFKPFLRRLHDFRLLTREQSVLTLASVMQGPLGNVLAPFVRLEQTDGSVTKVRLASSWFPKDLNMPAAWYNDVARRLEENPPAGVTVEVTSARMVGYEMKESLLQDCGWISLVIGICVAIALGVAFRSLKTSLLASIPLLYAYAAMLAGVTFSQLMGWDFSLNFVNLIMFPLLLGSGIDAGIYMVYEASTRQPPIEELMAETGRSVLCCTLTTLVGFGSFLTSSYTGLISLGIAALFGYTGAMFGALIVLPALLEMLKVRRAAAAAVPAHGLTQESSL